MIWKMKLVWIQWWCLQSQNVVVCQLCCLETNSRMILMSWNKSRKSKRCLLFHEVHRQQKKSLNNTYWPKKSYTFIYKYDYVLYWIEFCPPIFSMKSIFVCSIKVHILRRPQNFAKSTNYLTGSLTIRRLNAPRFYNFISG